MMHILEIPSFFPPMGGDFCLNQAKVLAALGHKVRIISNVQLGMTIEFKDYCLLSWHRYEHQMDGILVYQSFQRGIPKMIRHNVKRWVNIVCSMFEEYVKKYGMPDILHAHCAKWAGYAAMKLGEEYQIPYVITEHLPYMLLKDEFGEPPSNAWQIPLLKKAYEQADRVIPVSEELVDDIACYYGKDYRWQYISNTIDTEFFHYQKRLSKEGSPYCFCCLADYFYRKGYDVLFAAYQKLQEEGCNVELHIAGRYTDSTQCQQEIERLKLKGVNIYGRVDKRGVRNLLYQCDALVLASRSEVQPLVLLEAMSTGIPVVSTECIPQNLRVNQGCFIVPVEDVDALAKAMKERMEDTTVNGEELSDKIRQMASPEVVGKRLEQLFSEIISSRKQ